MDIVELDPWTLCREESKSWSTSLLVLYFRWRLGDGPDSRPIAGRLDGSGGTGIYGTRLRYVCVCRSEVARFAVRQDFWRRRCRRRSTVCLRRCTSLIPSVKVNGNIWVGWPE
jgi:hypothetical protein